MNALLNRLSKNKFFQFVRHSSHNQVSRIVNLSQLPKRGTRYFNAIAGLAFVASMCAVVESLTTMQLKASTTFKFSLAAVQASSEVQEVLGSPVHEGWTARSKRNGNVFYLYYSVYGDKQKGRVRSITQTTMKNVTIIYLGVEVPNQQEIVLVDNTKN